MHFHSHPGKQQIEGVDVEQLLTAKDLAEKLGVKLSTIYDWSYQGRIPRVPGMRLLRFREAEVDAWLGSALEVPAPAPRQARSSPPTGEAKAKASAFKKRGRRAADTEIDRMVERARQEVLGNRRRNPKPRP